MASGREGFTLMEMLVVLVIFGVLSAMATASWNRFSTKMKVAGAVQELRGAIAAARSDAISRKRYSGIVLDFSQRRFFRFVDSSGTPATSQNCRNEVGEKILQNWTDLSSNLLFYAQASSISPEPSIRACGVGSSASTDIVQSGSYSVVFRPDGSSCASLDVRMGVSGMPADTMRLSIQPPTGLVSLAR